MEKTLKKLRSQIQKIDHKMVMLLNQRIEAVHQIGQIKTKLRMPVIDKEREKQVLSHVINSSHNPIHADSIQKIYQYIIQICRETQTHTLKNVKKG